MQKKRTFILLALALLSIPMLSSLHISSLIAEEPVAADTIQKKGPKYSVRKTDAQTTDELKKKTADLRDPDNLQTEVSYDEKDDTYTIGTALSSGNTGASTGNNTGSNPNSGNRGAANAGNRGAANASRNNTTNRGGSTGSAKSGTGNASGSAGNIFPSSKLTPLNRVVNYLSAPIIMSREEYQEWSMRQSMQRYFRDKNAEAYEQSDHDKFDFTDMHFDLGPAEKIFGPGGVQIKTQGDASIKMGANLKKVDNPSLAANRRKTFGFDFDEKINLSLNGSVGDKVKLKLNYDTDAEFSMNTQDLKLKFDGKEDDIVKLVEAGNVSMPSNNSLVRGGSTLFGVRTDLQFGKLRLQTVVSQKKSSSVSVSSKGGASMNNFEFSATEYEENRHFFLGHFFRQQYDKNMKSLPTIASGVSITRIEVWVTNKNATTQNNRNIIALSDLGESTFIGNSMWNGGSLSVPSNKANNEYSTLANTYSDARIISQATDVLDGIGMEGSVDYEKLQSARLLSKSDYYLSPSLGYISLNTTLQSDDVLAVAYEYTYNGQTYQVGEFSSDLVDNTQALYVKLLKGTTGSPQLPTWRLMMKNIYNLGATQTSKQKFRLDIKYQNDSAGVYVTYLPEERLKGTTLLKALNLDRLDANNHANSNGQFDYVEDYTIRKGRIIFPVAEPFGEHLRQWIGDDEMATRYCFPELYDSTKTVAKQIAEHDKFLLTGQYQGKNGSIIELGPNISDAEGSVVVTAGGVTLTENVDYTVDYHSGQVEIINRSIIDAGTEVKASVESNEQYGMQRKTMVGMNLDYEFNKNLVIGGSLMFLNEQPLTTKVAMGEEPLKNTLWGAHLSWKRESQWLTNMLAKLPLVHSTQPSHISFNGEFAQLVAGQNKRTQGGASYLDDFESSTTKDDISTPQYWIMSSTPSMFTESRLTNDVRYGFNRALLSWYTVDPIFTRRSSTLTPSHIKSDLEQLSNHYVREVYERELYPQKAQNSYSSASSLRVLNLAYYPTERGAYNLSTEVNEQGELLYPQQKWGGMMRKIDNPDFETRNIEYIEFWMMDPFIYSQGQTGLGGDFYINLGEVSEDILKDGKKYYESGLPVDGNQQYYTETAWGRVPSNTTSVTYAFNNEGNARKAQDVGLNGLTSEQEQTFPTYAKFLQEIQGKVTKEVYDTLASDPASDNYHYYRGTDFDKNKTSILDRYKRINMPEGNSPDSQNSPERYETAYKTTPDVEDINQDNTLNEYEKYYQYRISIRPEDLVVGRNHIADKRVASVKLRNGSTENCTWYLFRVPLDSYDQKVGSINDFTSIRFMRMFLTGFQQPVILRFATLDLVRGDWRHYQQALYQGEAPATSGVMTVSTVNIEENGDKSPVNYVLPPGISRNTDPSQRQVTEENEQALSLTAENLAPADARAIYKNCKYDMRQYKHLQLFVHANALQPDVTDLRDGETSIFIRLGSDYKSNFYEYEVPLVLTPEGHYDTYSYNGCRAVWPEENMIDIDLDILTNIKKNRNREKSLGVVSFNQLFSQYDENHPNNRISIMGNPSLGEVKTIMIGVRNNGRVQKSVEVWVNELRLQEFTNEGGWAARGQLSIQLSDLGSVNANGHVETAGFGGLEQSVSDRKDENTYDYSVTTQLDLGKVLPEKAKVNLPFYYSYQRQNVKPKYNPLDTDMLLTDAMDALTTQAEKDSLSSLTTTNETQRNLSLSGVKVNVSTKKHPMPYDPANFTFNYSHQETRKEGVTTVYEQEKTWRGGMSYSWTPNWKTWEPFKKMKSKSKWLDIVKDQNLNFAPQSITFNTDLNRSYYELQERDIDNIENPSALPLNFSQSFLWNRDFQLRWDIFKSLHFTFQSATHAEVEEPYTPVNKDLYADSYTAWKDSVKTSLQSFGRPLDYSQTAQLSYKLPINRLPMFDWVTADGSYNGTYSWRRGAELEDGSTLGNTINTQRQLNFNGKFNLETLYNHSTFLKEANKRFSASSAKTAAKKKVDQKKKDDEAKKKAKEEEKKARAKAEEESKRTGVPADSIMARQAAKQTNAKGQSAQKVDPKKTNGFAQEVQLRVDTTVTIAHNLKNKRLIVTARDSAGNTYKLNYKVLDDNKIVVRNLDSLKVRVNITAKSPLEENKAYTATQAAARFLMMVRNVSLSYRNTYNLSLPGFMPEVGDMLGQRSLFGGGFAPGLDFGFGLVGDSYLDRAKERGWLLCADSVATPATTATTEDLQLKASLEPFTDLKIDLNASRTVNRNRSVQYMYQGNPTTETGSFNMTTISIGTAFQSVGNARNGYTSKAFKRFLEYLPIMQQRVERLYAGIPYPAATGLNGTFDPANGTASLYGSDVMIPAFLAAYTGGNPRRSSMEIFPSLKRLLPNWTINYKGLSNLPWLRDQFKSVTINHGYKSIFSIGSYNTFSSWMQAMTGADLGFVESTTGAITPSSMYDITSVAINESFSPLAGVNVTFQNNMTAKLEYKTTRVLTLSMTSAQINETASKDIVLGWGYKIADFKIASYFGNKAQRKANKNKNASANDEKQTGSNARNTSTTRSTSASRSNFAHSLNLRFDFSLRNQSALTRDIQTGLTEATSGNKAIKTSFQADYAMSRMVTFSLYYDRQRNQPLLSNTSFPTITQDFGFSMKFALTR